MDWIKAHLSLLVSIVVALAQVVIAAVSDGHITELEGIVIVAAVGNIAIVYIAPNLPGVPWIKSVATALIAAMAAAQTYLASADHLTAGQWGTIALLFLGALGIHVLPNQGDLSTKLAAAGVTVDGAHVITSAPAPNETGEAD